MKPHVGFITNQGAKRLLLLDAGWAAALGLTEFVVSLPDDFVTTRNALTEDEVLSALYPTTNDERKE